MWSHSFHQNIYEFLPVPETCGWTNNPDGTFAFDWDSKEVQQTVQKTIEFLMKGCSCKKGCTSHRCGCVKNSRQCGPSCHCQNCQNASQPSSDQYQSNAKVLEEPSSTYHFDSECSDNEMTDYELSSGESSDSETEGIETEVISDLYYDLNDYSIEL